jgi:quaternary ammonium compound-resistance protein SugE
MAWLFLLLAGLLEVAWPIMLKSSQGFTRLWPSVGFLVTGGLSFWLLAVALRSLPVGTAYAVWTGIGAAGAAIVGMAVLGESRDVLKIVSLILLLGGIAGLRLTSGH